VGGGRGVDAGDGEVPADLSLAGVQREVDRSRAVGIAWRESSEPSRGTRMFLIMHPS